MRTLLCLIKKELTQTLRDKRMRFILFAVPVIQLIIFGYVVTTDIKNISVLVMDSDQTMRSREFVSLFFSSGYFSMVKVDKISKNAPEEMLKANQAKVILVIPPDFSKNIDRNLSAKIQILMDGSDANSAIATKGYIEQIILDYSARLIRVRQNLLRNIQNQSVSAPGMIIPEIRVLYNPEMKSANFMIPGLLCLILLGITAILTAMAIVREKELGTLEQVLVSPLKKWEFILGKAIPFMLVGFIDVLLILGIARILFVIPIRGSLLLLFITATIFLFTTLGIGFLASIISKTQTQAMLTVFPIMMPSFLLSGLFFPIASIPVALRCVAYINPLTYFLIIVRGILLKGAGFFELYKEILILLILGIFFITFSSLRLKKRIE